MRRLMLVLLLCLLLTAVACSSAPSPETFRREAEESLPTMPGIWYADGKEPWEKEYLPKEIEEQFFGDAEMACVQYRLFLGTDGGQMAELLIASLETEKEAVTLSAHLAARLSGLKGKAETAFPSSLSDAAVYRKGKTVLYTATPYNAQAVALFR